MDVMDVTPTFPAPPSRIRTAESWVVQWDDDWRLFLIGPDVDREAGEPFWHTENVISFYHRVPDPDGQLIRLLRMVFELDGPSAHPRQALRVWLFLHSAATLIDCALLARHEASATYKRRRGAFKLASGHDLLEGCRPAPIDLR